jgi:hypothetical protein
MSEKVALAPALWHDPDVRWLTGLHEAKGHFYLVRENYEELLWWLLMPSLLSLAAEPVPNREAIAELSKTINEALATAEEAGYSMDELLGSAPDEEIVADEDEAVPDESIADGDDPDDDLDDDGVDFPAIIEQGSEIDDDLEFQEDEDEELPEE